MNRFQLRFPVTELKRIAATYDVRRNGDDKVESARARRTRARLLHPRRVPRALRLEDASQ
jgi:hypothetical protein